MYETWHFLAGLGLFLYGISRIELALRELGGRKFVVFLRSHTSNPVESVLSGTVLTALLQSSSLVSLMVLAFVGSQFIPLPNALGIIMGANLGTTFTGWIVAFFGFKLDIEFYSLPIISIGALGLVFLSREQRLKYVSMLILGFGLLLFGLSFMKSGMESIVAHVDITEYTHYGVIHFFILGIVVTAIIQSSSAMMAITLSALSLETISIPQAAATVIGADLGTTVTVILGSLSGVAAKKQVAFFHFIFNLVVDLLALASLPLLLYLISDIIQLNDPLYTLVLFHNLFNAAGIVLFLPFLPIISNIITKKYSGDNEDSTLFLKNVDQKLPAIPFDSVRKEIEHMFVQVIKFNMQILQLSANQQNSILKNYAHYVEVAMSKNERYEYIKRLESEIISFIINLKQRKLSDREISSLSLWVASIRNLVHSARSIKSIRHDLASIVRLDDEHSYKNREELISKSINLYRSMIQLIDEKSNNTLLSVLAGMEATNENTHDQLVEYIYGKYHDKVSTPLNVIREIYSSNKALINAMEEYKLDMDKLSTFDIVPMLVR